MCFESRLPAQTESAFKAPDWPQFRGPDGQGHASVKSLPLLWSDDSDNIQWKVSIEGLGWSSPVIAGGRVWLTTATQSGTSLRALCLDANTGRKIHDVEVFQLEKKGHIHKKNSHASPTPILDGTRVYVHFGASGTACLSDQGEVLWRRTLEHSDVHGPGGSPALVGDSLVINCDGFKAPFVVALSCKTGKPRWKIPRQGHDGTDIGASFCTPLMIEMNGKQQVVSPGANLVASYDPGTGRSLWHVRYIGYSVAPRPVFGHGLVFISTSFNRPVLLAIRPDGEGDVTDSHVAWRMEQGVPHTPSPLLVGDELYLVSDKGIASCLDAKTGDRHWRERLGGNFSGSPLHAAGRIYFLDEDGVTTVIQPGKTFQKLAKNEIEGRTLASLAAIEGALFLRTDTHLFRIATSKNGRDGV
jgi:outer membrane protein assembly factor BamB